MSKLPDHLFVDSFDGDLYDTRVAKWFELPPLRKGYCRPNQRIRSVSDFKASLRYGGYVFPGGYAAFFVTNDGAEICFACARGEFRQIAYSIANRLNDGWRIMNANNLSYYDTPVFCAHCNKEIR